MMTYCIYLIYLDMQYELSFMQYDISEIFMLNDTITGDNIIYYSATGALQDYGPP